jgi:sugar O-acyltransferase (sialic acid O-acetyltransferase NeuD family)
MTLLIYGAGGLGREVLSALWVSGEHVSGFVVDPGFPVADIQGVQVRAEHVETLRDPSMRFVLAVGDGRARQRAALALGPDAVFATVRHPAAVIGSCVSIGPGAMVIGLCSITTDVSIGHHVLINPGCTIAHDCVLEDFVNLGPSCALAGRVTVQAGANLGVGVSVAPGVVIGAWSTVGAGAVVIRDVEPGSTVVGVPARPIRRTGSSAGAVPPSA